MYIAKIYPNTMSLGMGMDNYLRDNPLEVDSINHSQQRINLRNGNRVFFIVMKSDRDNIKVMGTGWSSIEVYDELDDTCKQYCRALLRGEDHDDDVTIRGEE